MNPVRSNYLSWKYVRFTPSGFKYRLENLSLWQKLNSFLHCLCLRVICVNRVFHSEHELRLKSLSESITNETPPLTDPCSLTNERGFVNVYQCFI